jgi:pimeloyl-ACP methyl ester carboxylesterase
MSLTMKYLNQFVACHHHTFRDLSFEDKKFGHTFAFALTAQLESPTNGGVAATPPESEKLVPKVVIFFHGTGNDSIFPHLGLFQDLLNQRYTVISFDLPGHGATSTTLLLREGGLEFMERTVSYFQSLYKNALFFGIGYSLGGAFLLRYAALRGLFKGIALVATPHRLELTYKAGLYESLSFIVRDIYAHRQYYGLKGLFPAVGPLGRRNFPIRLGDRRPYWQVVSDIIRDCEVEKSLRFVSCRTLLIYGQWDTIAPPPPPIASALAGGSIDGSSEKNLISVVSHQTHYSLLFYRRLGAMIMESFRLC